MGMVFAWLAVALVVLGLNGLGRLVMHPAEGNFLGAVWWGWGLGALLLTMFVCVTKAPVTPFLIALGGVSIFGYARHWPTREEWLDTGRLVLLSLPMVWAWSFNQVFMWDDFSHRLPSLHYVYAFDALPRHDLPASLSDFPSYPYALTILGVAVTRLLGHYMDLAVALVNGAMLLMFAAVLAQFLGRKPGTWQTLATGVALATMLCPLFSTDLVASAYQDVPLGLALAVAFMLVRPYFTAQVVPTAHDALCIGLTLALVTGLKQVGFVLAVMFVMPLVFVLSFRLRMHPLRAGYMTWLLVGPMVLIWGGWRYYVAVNIGGGEFSFLPWAQWQWELWPQMLASWAKITVQKPFVMLPLFMVNVLTLIAYKRKAMVGSQGLYLLFASTVGWGYVAFLMVTYIGSFGGYEAAKLASFSRYMQHVNWLLWVAILGVMKDRYWVTRVAHKPIMGRAMLAMMLVPLAVPFQFVGKANKEVEQMRAIALKLPETLPVNQNLLVRVNEPGGSGFRANVLRYYVHFGYRIQGGETMFGSGPVSSSPDAILKLGKVGESVELTRCRGGVCDASVTLTQ